MAFLNLLSPVSSRCLLLAAIFSACGCVSRETWPRTEHNAASAAGIADLIRFEYIAAPADLPDWPDRSLTLEQAAERALTTHPEIQAALARVRAAHADARQSRLLPNPVLSVAIRYPEGGGRPTIDAGLGADLIAILQRPGQANAADARLRAASAQAISTTLDVLQEVQDRYVAAQSLDALLPVLESRRTLLGRLHAIAQSRLRAGEGTQLDVTTLESQRLELDLEAAERQLERREERLALARLIGRPSGTAEWNLTPLMAASPNMASEDKWIVAALANRAEIQVRVWEIVALGGELRAARLAALEGTELGVDAERDGPWSAGPAASVPLPIFDWGQARRDKLRASQIEARHNLTQERRRVIEEVRRAHASLGELSNAARQARERLIPLMQKRLEQAEGQYLAGQADITSLVLAEQELQSARAREIELNRRAAGALSRLQRAVGGPGIAHRLTTPSTRSAPTAATLPATQPIERPNNTNGNQP